MKNFLQKIQNSPEYIKTRWLVGLSAGAMIVVVFVWISFFNTLIEPKGKTEPVAKGSRDSFLGTMKQGASVLGSSVQRGIRGLGGILEAPRDYIINP